MNKLLLISALCTVAAIAQPPGGPTQSFTEIKAFLNLSDAQFTSIRAARTAAQEANATLHTTIRTKRTALADLLAKGSTDANAIGKAVLEFETLRKQFTANMDKARTQALSFLSADQKTKLKQLEDAEKLEDDIHEAHALLLLAPPADTPFAAGPRPFSGPENF